MGNSISNELIPLFYRNFCYSCLSLYINVSLSPSSNVLVILLLALESKMYLLAMPKMYLLSSSSLTAASTINLRGFVSYSVPWLAGMHGLVFVSIL